MFRKIWSRLAYLREEGGKLPKCLDPWLVERAQKWKHHQLLRPEVRRQFYDIQQRCTVIVVAPGTLLRELPVDSQFMRPVPREDLLEHDGTAIHYASCVHCRPQLRQACKEVGKQRMQ